MIRSRASRLALAASLLLCAPAVASADEIKWSNNLKTTEAAAKQDHKLVLQFFMIGKLGAADC